MTIPLSPSDKFLIAFLERVCGARVIDVTPTAAPARFPYYERRTCAQVFPGRHAERSCGDTA